MKKMQDFHQTRVIAFHQTCVVAFVSFLSLSSVRSQPCALLLSYSLGKNVLHVESNLNCEKVERSLGL